MKHLGLIIALLLVLFLICGCYAPRGQTCIDVTYHNCVDAEAATWFCGEKCRAMCRAFAVKDCQRGR